MDRLAREWRASIRWSAMGRMLGLCVLVAGLARADGTSAPVITTIAGGGSSTSDGIVATTASLSPTAVTVDGQGNLYLIDVFKVRKVRPDGVIVTVAGDGTQLYDGDNQPATAAAMDPRGIAADAVGNLYIADGANHRVRKVSTSGVITTIAGNGASTYSGDGGNALSAGLSLPTAIAVDGSGNVFVVDSERVRKIAPGGSITVVAGNGGYQYTGEGGAATATGMNPKGVALDKAGNLYIADLFSNRILKVTGGVVRTIAGGGRFRSDPIATSVVLYNPDGVAVDAKGNVYFSEQNQLVRMVTPQGILAVVAGTFNDTPWGNVGGVMGFSGDGGPANQATLRSPAGVAVDATGNVFVADSENLRVRKVTPMPVVSVPVSADAFAPVQDHQVGSYTESVAIADVTGDGRDDALLTTSSWGPGAEDPNDYKLFLYVQKPDGTLAAPIAYSYPPGRMVTGLMAADLNHDGYADAVLGHFDGIIIFRGGPNGLAGGVLSPGISRSEISGEVVPMDMDGDGNLDVVAFSVGTNQDSVTGILGITIHYGDGRGGISRRTFIAGQAGDKGFFRIADFNRDRLPDLATAWEVDPQHGGVEVRLHDHSGGFYPPMRLSAPDGSFSSGLATGDFDGDGLLDLIVSKEANTPDAGLALFRQSPAGSFQLAKSWATFDLPGALQGADINGDGFADLQIIHQGWSSLGYQEQLGGALQQPVKYYRPSSTRNNAQGIAIGDLNSDGCPDVAIADYNYGLEVFPARPCLDLRPARATMVGDFNGDGIADVLWRHARSGADAIWRSANASTPQAMTGVTTVAWKIVAVADLDGDNVADVVWRNIRTGSNALWRSGNAASSISLHAVTDQAWSIVGAGDFDADGRADLLWRNSRTGANVIWKAGNYVDSLPVLGVANPDWQIVGLGDFDGDGRCDVLWRNGVTGANVIWRAADGNAPMSVTAVTSQAWKIVGVGDIDGDHRADVIWRNMTNGANSIWKSANSATALAMTSVTNQAWQVAGVGDFDGDHKADVLWRDDQTGANTIWRSGISSTQQAVASMADTGWKVVPSALP